MENLQKYNTKSWFKSALLGFLIGLAIIVPGVSGSTIAIIFGLYTSLLYAFGNILKEFKSCFAFLLPIAIGGVVGFVIGFFAVQYLYNLIPFSIICLFAGLMIGAYPIILDEIKPISRRPKHIILMLVGVILPIIISVVSIVLNNSASSTTFGSFPWYMFVLYLPLGFAVGITQIVPGLSATALLLIVGQFKPLLNSIHLHYISAHPQIIALLLILIIGFVIGIIVCSKVLTLCLNRDKYSSYCVISGLSLGAILSMFVNPDIALVYELWGQSRTRAITDISIGAVLLIIGIALTYSLVRFERAHKVNQVAVPDTTDSQNNLNTPLDTTQNKDSEN